MKKWIFRSVLILLVLAVVLGTGIILVQRNSTEHYGFGETKDVNDGAIVDYEAQQDISVPHCWGHPRSCIGPGSWMTLEAGITFHHRDTIWWCYESRGIEISTTNLSIKIKVYRSGYSFIGTDDCYSNMR